MNIIKAAAVRGLLPASAVAIVFVLSLSVPVPLGAISGAAYGYNCGVKGNGYHDHGKVCPNRPFPGKGKGLTKFGINSLTTQGSIGVGKKSEIDLSTSEDAGTTNINTGGSSHAHHGRGKDGGHAKGHSDF